MGKKGDFNCKKCGIKIDGHNFYLHEGMCNDCFFEIYFPEPDDNKLKEEIKRVEPNLKQEYKKYTKVS